jgi:nucleoside-diphosphate-sugar epimerase
VKIVITGCSGFIGNYLTRYFLDKRWFVYGISRRRVNISNKNFHWIQSSIDKCLFQLPPVDFCVHAAALSPNNKSSNVDYINTNVIGTSNLLRSIIESKCKKIVFLSGVSLYGKVLDKVIDEETPVINPCVYGVSKYLAEREIIEQENIEYIILRLPGVLGKNAKTPWLVQLIKNMIKDQSIDVYNKDESFNNAVDVYDLSKFIDLCLSDYRIKNEIFVLSAFNSMKISEIIDYIKTLTNSKSIISFYNKGNSFTIDCSKSVKFGYKASGMKDILKKQIETILKLEYSTPTN